MKSLIITILLAHLFLSGSASSQTPLTTQDSLRAVADATGDRAQTQVAPDSSLVSVLGYHDFTQNRAATEMLLPVSKFRSQMQAIKDLGLHVITLEEFLAWKTGKLKLPERSILITIDDGWKSVYTDAYPILKEFNYPFTLFLYKNYVDGGGKALSSSMIQEMQANGASIGSHSVSHPYPSVVKKQKRLGTENYERFLKTEFGDSKAFLESQFDQPVTTYAYPGGYHTPEMFLTAETHGYTCLFTVLPGKVSKNDDNQTLPRYIILGTHDSIFEAATRFPATATSSATLGAIVQTTEHPVSPAPGSTVGARQPTLTADLSQVENLDPESIVMRVSGFGKVPAIFDAESKKFSWKVNRRLRKPTCDITVSWKLLGGKSYEKPMRWTFIVDRHAAYLPTTAPSLPAGKPSASSTISE